MSFGHHPPSPGRCSFFIVICYLPIDKVHVIGDFTRTFKKRGYDYIDSFKEMHIMAQRKVHGYIANLTVLKGYIWIKPYIYSSLIR